MERSGRSGLVHWSTVQLPNPLLTRWDGNCSTGLDPAGGLDPADGRD